jgi:parvulin-like peptidyl-prolyl isomerase
MAVMKIILYIIFITFFHISYCNSSDQGNITAVVGDDIITNLDVEERIKVITPFIDPDLRAKTPLKAIHDQVVQALIDEKLLAQEAERLHINVSDEEFNYQIEYIEQLNNIKKGEFWNFIKQNGLPKDGVMNQLRGQIIIRNILNLKLRPKIEVTSQEIEEVLGTIVPENAEANFKQIIISSDNLDNEKAYDDMLNKLNSLRGKIKSCKNMEDVALGEHLTVDSITLPLSKLHPDLRNMIKILPVGSASKVIKTGSDMRIIVVCKRNYNGLSSKEKDEVREMIIQRKIEKQAKHFINNLRQKTFIEIKS